MNQYAFTRLQLAALKNIGPNSEKVFRQCGGLQHGKTFWDWQRLSFWHSDKLCIGAAIGERAKLVAQTPLGNALSQCHHFARNF